eukprot:1136276-Pelagomonas_calceolata.AAC.4
MHAHTQSQQQLHHPPGRKSLSLQSTNNREGEAATVRAHQPPTTQHQHQPPPAAGAAAGAAAPGQNTGGAVKKGQGANADQDSQAQARKIAQAIEGTRGPPRRYGISGGCRASKLWEWASSFLISTWGLSRGIL